MRSSAFAVCLIKTIMMFFKKTFQLAFKVSLFIQNHHLSLVLVVYSNIMFEVAETVFPAISSDYILTKC